MNKNYWFKRRRYGYGWIPSSWQGWLILACYAGIVIFLTLLVNWNNNQPSVVELTLFFTAFISITILLVLITYLKGPIPKWRWGKTDNDNPDEDF